jgi:hypothetical protein
MLLVPRPRSVFARGLIHLVKKLIVHNLAPSRNFSRFPQVGDVDVIDAPGENLAIPLELLERGNGLLQRTVGAPMQKIAIKPVSMEPGERCLASFYCSAPRGILRQDLCDQKDLVTPSGDRFAHHFLGGSRTVHFGGITLIRAEINTCAQCVNSCIEIFIFDVPGSPANHQDFALG